MPRVAIVGAGQTVYQAEKDEIYTNYIYEATRQALADAGLSAGDVETVVGSSVDAFDGRTISSEFFADPTGSFLKDLITTADDGIFALINAYMRVASGSFEIALAMSHSHTEGSLDSISNLSFDPLFMRPFGMNRISSLALQANAYMHKYGFSKEQAAKVVLKNRRSGIDNPYAQLRSELTIEEVLGSEMVCYPLKRLDLPPLSTGACAVVLVSEEMARRVKGTPVWIDGVGWASGTYQIGAVDLAGLTPLTLAAKRAYTMAGIRDPIREIDVAEISDVTSFHEPMEYEALGFCAKGEGGSMIDRGVTDREGGLPVNPSGGMLCGNPHLAAGLIRIAEAYIQLKGEGGKRQVSGAKTALAHGVTHFNVCQDHGVVILRREE